MTVRQVYEYSLVEVNKLKAPSLLLEDYIYLLNKAIQQKINEIYNRFAINQQSSDDLMVLQAISTIEFTGSPEKIFGDTVWKFELPEDYLHILNCISEFKGVNKNNCNKDESVVISKCFRLTADLYPGILDNYYMKPSYTKPYYYIVNYNTSNKIVTNTEMDDQIINESNTPPKMIEMIEMNSIFDLKNRYDRKSNQSSVRLEIHSGDSNWILNKIMVTYLKSPMYVSMSQEDILSTEDYTQVLEFPDYMCYEIINTFVKLILENSSDPRLQTNVPINNTIAIPGNN